MARIRTIKPEFPQSEDTGKVSRDARLLFVLLWTLCDDAGRCRAASRMLASLLFPYDEDAPELVDQWLEELEGRGLIRRYSVDGASYLQVCKWLKHQKIDKPTPSKLPPFAEDSTNPREASPLEVDLGPGSGKGREEPLAPSASPLDAVPPENIVEKIPLCDKTEFAVTKDFVAELDRLYPAVDPVQTLREIRGWCLGNPKRTKTARG
jgi:hypothetical protein